MASNRNGILVLQTLETLSEPSTSLTISKKIANDIGVNLEEIKDCVQQTLDGGVKHGFVQKYNRKYLLQWPNELENANEDVMGGEEVQDRARRRTRKYVRRTGRRPARRSRMRRS